ncbi:MAG: AEC family transporter, partial [Janthinobacterium lividum]
MLATIEILFPIFALILAGFLCRKRAIFGSAAGSELNRLVVWLALPALLFDIMAHASWHELNQPAFIAAFGLGCAAVFAGVLAVALIRGRHLADASIEAIAAAYPNTGYMGFPLGLALFGKASLAPVTIATIIVVCVVFAVAIALIEISLESERRAHIILLKIVLKLLRNPLVFAPLAGVLMAASGLTMPAGLEHFLKLAGAAASPCALICLGVFLAEKRPAGSSHAGALALTLVKLLVQPAMTWWLATRVFHMPGQLVQMAVVLAALPTGTGPFMLAEYYQRAP